MLIYYQDIIAGTSRGNMTAGQKIIEFGTLDNEIQNYANHRVSAEALVTTVAATLAYAVNLVNVPVMPGSVVVTSAAPAAFTLTDDGNGNLLGAGMWGTVNYITGAVTLQYAADPTVAVVTVDYVIDIEAQATLPSIELAISNDTVKSEPYGLKVDSGLLESFQMRKRFGTALDQMLAKSLTGALTNETFGAALAKLAGNSAGNTTFSLTVPSGVTREQHLSSEFKRVVAAMETVLLANVGIGNLSSMVLGRDAASVVSEIPGFKRVTGANTTAPHIFGSLNGITIIRVPNAAQLGVNAGFGLHKGSDFTNSLTMAMYMPVMVLPRTVNFNNPLNSTSGIVTQFGLLTPQRGNFNTGITFA